MLWHPQLTCQDRIDGGISILLRSPGYRIDDTTMMHDLVIDMYCTPRAVVQGGSQITSDLAVIAQFFAQDLVMPCLCQFQERCEAERVTPPALPCMFFSSSIQSIFFQLYGQLTFHTSFDLTKMDGSDNFPPSHQMRALIGALRAGQGLTHLNILQD